MMSPKAGFISITGRPNVGKSTFLNYVIGQKLAGVSPKPQTTRQVIRGILTEPRGQIVFLDTPGVHEAKDAFSTRMQTAAESAFEDADMLLWMVAPEPPGRQEKELIEKLANTKKPIFLLVNQVDKVKKESLLPVMEAYSKLHSFKDIYPISALRGTNIPELMNQLFECLPENPHYFPDDQVSNQSQRFVISEIIREKVFRLTKQEIPYATAVQINDFKERSERIFFIDATIYVERDSQKKIVIGERATMVKRIGKEARMEIERTLGRGVFLQLKVEVKEAWKNDKAFLEKIEHEGEII